MKRQDWIMFAACLAIVVAYGIALETLIVRITP